MDSAMDVGTEMNKVLEANYPETIRRIFIINGAYRYFA